jgi:hypothetical protein
MLMLLRKTCVCLCGYVGGGFSLNSWNFGNIRNILIILIFQRKFLSLKMGFFSYLRHKFKIIYSFVLIKIV